MKGSLGGEGGRLVLLEDLLLLSSSKRRGRSKRRDSSSRGDSIASPTSEEAMGDSKLQQCF